MRPLSPRLAMPRLNLLVGLSMAAFIALCAAFAGGAGAGVAGKASFTDPAGDAQGGPDLTGATVTGDAATGLVSLSVNVTGFPTAVTDGLERYVAVWIDTDKNSATGDPEDGTDYTLQTWVDPTGRWWAEGRWNGSAYDEVSGSTTTFSRTGDTATWNVSATQLGATSFRFYVIAGTWNEAEKKSVTRDVAPAPGWWEYDISAPDTPTSLTPSTGSARVLIAAPTASPKAPTAGKRFTVSFDVKLEKTQPSVVFDIETGQMREVMVVTWQPLSRGKVVATPSVGGKTIRHTTSLRNGKLRVSLVIPKGALGKLLRVPVKITATESGKTISASKVATFRIR